MYIKQITISGFKSYKETTKVEGFHPGFNVIVGRNGSGKSNLFAAIEFALTLEFRNMRPEERNLLLYNGNKVRGQEAFVEIVFDNTDRKLPMPADTVTFRRLVGAKKDKFFCNGKELPNAKQFLDVAGLTNTFVIVKQGKVNQLAQGTDKFRFNLLETIAGSAFFDDKMQHAAKVLKNADDKKAKVEDILQKLNERMANLEGEAKELKNFLTLDSQRRAIEHIVNEREQRGAKKAMAECEATRAKLSSEQEPVQKELQNVKKEHQKLKEARDNINRQIISVNTRKDEIFADIPGLVSEQERLKHLREDFRKQFEEEDSTKVLGVRVKKLEKAFSKNEENLNKAKEELAIAGSSEELIVKRLIEKDVELKTLEGRLQGTDEFLTDSKRKNWILKMKKQSGKAKEASTKAKTKLASLEKEKRKDQESQKTSQIELNEIRLELSRLQKEYPDLELFNGQKSRNEMWKNLNEIDGKLAHEKGVRFNIIEQLQKQAGRAAINGWEGIQLVLEELRRNGQLDVVQGYHGLVLENFTCDDGMDIAIEAAAGNKLCYHIVQNNRVGRKLMSEFNRRKLKGTVFFIPIEELDVRTYAYPEENNAYCQLMSTIEYSPELIKIFQYIFGSYLLCREWAGAVTYSKINKMNCVTTEGDKVSMNGPITGGYMGRGLTKLELQRGKSASDKKFQEMTTQKASIEKQLKLLDDLITKAIKEQESRTSRNCSLTNKKERKECELKTLTDRLHALETSISCTYKDIEKWDREVYELSCRETKFQEVCNKSRSTDSQVDRRVVLDLRKEVKKLTRERGVEVSKKLDKEKAVSYLLQKIDQLKLTLDDERCKGLELHSSQEQEQRLEDLDKAIDSIALQIVRKQEESDLVAEDLPVLKSQLLEKNSELEVFLEKEKVLIKKLYALEKKLHQQLTFMTGHNQKMVDTLEEARQLGIIPSDLTSFQDLPSADLYKKLKRLKKQINRTVGVNQKAAEQWNEITEHCNGFTETLNRLQRNRQDLDDIIRDLGLKKGDSILKIFRVLQEQFKNIFSQVVPEGVAELILYGNEFEIDSASSSSGSADSDNLRHRAGNHVKGVKIKVNFINKTVPEMQQLLQLSGGQKSVVALCLILAIQKVDPVPFYLFDEVDQALDPQYRAAFTKVIHNLAEEFKLQFICTTFRREFLAEAHKCFGVSYSRAHSTVRPVTLAEATNFVEADTATETSGLSSGSQDQEKSSNSPNSDVENESSSNNSDINMPPPRLPHKENDSQISFVNISQTFSGSTINY